MSMTNPVSTPRVSQSPAADQTRLALIGAGLRLFGSKGFDGASTRDIAAEARANIGSIAYHFGGKDGLRAACAAHIVDTVRSIAGQALAAPPPDDAAGARAMLERALEQMVGFIVARPEAGEIVQFILRELAQPTSALDAIYEGVFAPLHVRLCDLWALATGEPADAEETKLTVFTLIGQIVYFRIGREAVKRRMGWSDIGPDEAARILRIARANFDAILSSRRVSP